MSSLKKVLFIELGLKQELELNRIESLIII
jgi:hypothetical protein